MLHLPLILLNMLVIVSQSVKVVKYILHYNRVRIFAYLGFEVLPYRNSGGTYRLHNEIAALLEKYPDLLVSVYDIHD